MDYYDDEEDYEDELDLPRPPRHMKPKFEDEDEDTRPAKANFKSNPRPKSKIKRKTDVVESDMSLNKAKRILSLQSGRKGRPSREVRRAKKVLATAGVDFKPRNKKLKKIEKVSATGEAKRSRGRPRKHPIVVNKLKRPRGRPKKDPAEQQAAGPKRPRGRPRKNPNEEPSLEKRKKNPDNLD